MENAVFIISEGYWGLNLSCKRYPEHSRLNITPAALYRNMSELADIFNNRLHIGIEFTME